ncbi:hypothetical protein [Oceanirhabdus sp. W0125-5]|uniref:hypothetical protein n=1 Tax=Oceanirhabdus sp. W0125-5 TaxID=2999116 RepID=UPI0022F319C7|nr:hypothetical protein [Oceanirhabdus sp. W0125-5]WBW96471.1 hypothetical protein OW730_22665 [Oceanirhabdus sp. W0125-5]
MIKNKKNIIIISILILVVLYGLTYIPHRISHIKPNEVSKINIRCGYNGDYIEITKKSDIEHIINNLNSVTFKKDKPSFFYMGYSFNLKIYNNKQRVIKKLIINSEETIRYKGFFHRAKKNKIDYEYIKNLFE